MTKSQAAEIIATDVRVFARTYGIPEITRDLIEARLSEARHLGGLKEQAAAVAPSWRTILRAVRAVD